MKYLKYFEDHVPQNAPIEDQLHIFDFDDTLGVTLNPNGVMLYNHGVPAHKTPEEVLEWLSKYGLSESDLIPGPDGQTIQFFDNLGGYAAYVNSAVLAKLTKDKDFVAQNRRYATDNGKPPPEEIDQALYIDFTPSGNIDQATTKPISNVIKKLNDMEEKGADTMVLTARKGEGSGRNFKGEEVPITNKRDIEEFLNNNDANPSTKPVDLVIGLGGGNKGEHIYKSIDTADSGDIAKEFPKQIRNKIKRLGEWPAEIHFYDDADQNTIAVDKALGGKVPSELYIYGPGEFAKGHASPNEPTKSFKNKK